MCRMHQTLESRVASLERRVNTQEQITKNLLIRIDEEIIKTPNESKTRRRFFPPNCFHILVIFLSLEDYWKVRKIFKDSDTLVFPHLVQILSSNPKEDNDETEFQLRVVQESQVKVCVTRSDILSFSGLSSLKIASDADSRGWYLKCLQDNRKHLKYLRLKFTCLSSSRFSSSQQIVLSNLSRLEIEIFVVIGSGQIDLLNWIICPKLIDLMFVRDLYSCRSLFQNPNIFMNRHKDLIQRLFIPAQWFAQDCCFQFVRECKTLRVLVICVHSGLNVTLPVGSINEETESDLEDTSDSEWEEISNSDKADEEDTSTEEEDEDAESSSEEEDDEDIFIMFYPLIGRAMSRRCFQNLPVEIEFSLHPGSRDFPNKLYYMVGSLLKEMDLYPSLMFLCDEKWAVSRLQIVAGDLHMTDNPQRLLYEDGNVFLLNDFHVS